MPTNNFKVFNENGENMLSQEEYNEHTQRQNGVSGIALIRLHNKLYRQVSTMAAAIGEILVAAGYDVSDENLPGLVEALTNTFVSQSGVKTVANKGPDAAGNVALVAGDIPQADGRSIEAAQADQDAAIAQAAAAASAAQQTADGKAPMVHTHTATQVSETTGETTEAAQRRQDAAIASKASGDIITTSNLTIPATGWVLDAASGFYYRDVPILGAVATDTIEVTIALASAGLAQKCGMAGINEARAGAVRLYAKKVPADAMQAVWERRKAVVV